MKKIKLFLFCLFVSITVWSQTPYFQKYQLLKKNEPVQINKIFQDQSGFIWYGTNHGLFKFDGVKLQHITKADSLPDDNVTALAEDSTGRIWLGHGNGKIAYINASQTIIQFNPSEGNSEATITDLLFDAKGNLWFSTQNDGLYYYTQNRLFRIDEENNLPDLFIYDILEDANGSIWAATDGGVAQCTLRGKDVNLKVYNSDNGLPDNIIKKLALGNNNTIWMATEDNGILEFNPKTAHWNVMIPYREAYGTITDFLVTPTQVWASTSQLGLIVFDQKNKQTKIYSNKLNTDLSFITCLLRDTEGNIWIGSKTGLSRCYSDYVEFLEDGETYEMNSVLALTFDHENNLWFANNNGLYKRHVVMGTSQTSNMLEKTKFKNKTIISLFTDAYGYIWAGLFGEGAIRINPTNGSITYLKSELRNGNVLSITGKGNMVWLATLGGGVRVTIDHEKLMVKNYTHTEGLISDYIYQIFVDSKDRVWFATDGRGVDMMDDEGFHHYEKDFSAAVVYGLVEDSQKIIWANVQGEGLYRFDGRKFSQVKNLKLRDSNINAFYSVKADGLVVMHDLGIDVINVQSMNVHTLADDGLINKTANLNAITADRYGRIYIGTDDGIITYDYQEALSRTAPLPFIDNVKVLNKDIQPVDNTKLDYDQNSVTIGFHGFWYNNPTILNYQYTLSQYDHEWIRTGDRSVTYSSLPPGDYTFKLKVSESDDFESAKETTFHFVIRPPFWRTTIFYFSLAALIIFSGYSYLKFRERKLIRDKVMLEVKVMERTQEIQRKTEEINAQAEEIRGINENLEMLVKDRTHELEQKNKALEESAFIIAHELRAPVASILGLINLISKTELKDQEKEIVNHMNESAERLNTIVRTITKAIERGDKV